jgi:hypothetical protein
MIKNLKIKKPIITLQSTESATYCELLTKSWREMRTSSEELVINSKMIVLIEPVIGFHYNTQRNSISEDPFNSFAKEGFDWNCWSK